MPRIWAVRPPLVRFAPVNRYGALVPRIDPDWWDHPELRPRLAVRDVQALYRWLQRHGLSQQQIASLTGQTQPEVSAILNGREVLAYSVLHRIAVGLGMPPGYMGLSGCIACSGVVEVGAHGEEGDDPMFRRQFLAAAAAAAAGGAMDGVRRLLPDQVPSAMAVPARVGAAEVAQVRETTAQFRALDYRFGHGAALDATRGFAGWAHGLLSGRQTGDTARELRIALADLHVLIAWDYHDGGRPTSARRHHAQALVLAREADEPAMVGQILGDVARVSTDRGDPREGIRLAGFALLATDPGDLPAIRAALHLEEAWARAHLADARGVREALARADDDLGRADPAAVPAWASSATHLFYGGDYTGFRGRIYQELARSREHRRYAETAVEHAEAAMAAYDGRKSRTGVVLNRISLATGQLRTGARDEGLRTAHEAVDQAAALRSARAHAQLADLSDAAGTYAGHPDADDLRHRVTALTAA